MRRLALFLCALAGAVLVQAFIRMVVAPGRRTATAGRDESGQEIGDWENEGGSLAVAGGTHGSAVPETSKPASAAGRSPREPKFEYAPGEEPRPREGEPTGWSHGELL